MSEQLAHDLDYYKHFTELLHLDIEFAPVGMITFGSPISLFLFRNYEHLGGEQSPNLMPDDLWRIACPPSFRQDGKWQGITWRWQNFWHPADFVAHRLSPLYAEGYPTQPTGQHEPFVRDVKMRNVVNNPVDAHTFYLDSACLIKRIGLQLALTLMQMNGYTIEDDHKLFSGVC